MQIQISPAFAPQSIEQGLVFPDWPCVRFAYDRLYELGQTDVAYPSVLARYGVAQFRNGCRIGNRMNGWDTLSPYAQRKNGIKVERLHRPSCKLEQHWK